MLTVGWLQHWVLPSLNWPSAEKSEAERRALEARLDEAGTQLQALREQTTTVLTSLETQAQELQTTLRTMQATLQALTQADGARDDDVRRLRDEVEAVKTALPRTLERAKEDQKYALADLQAEVKSLKGLLLNRRPIAATPATATLVPAGTAAGSVPTTPGTPALGGPSAAPSVTPRGPMYAGRASATDPLPLVSSTPTSTPSPMPPTTSATPTAGPPQRAYIPAWQLAAPAPTAVAGATSTSTSTTESPAAGEMDAATEGDGSDH
jgi:peroxin-14